MATRVSIATGNFTTAGTWKVCSAVSNAEVDSDAGTLNTTNSAQDSTSFVPAATKVDGIAIKISAIVTPTGTLAVSFRNSTSPGSRDFTITINASDLNAAAQGWIVLSAGAGGVTPNGTDSYVIRTLRSVADSAGNRIQLYASASTAATISREVILTTTGAPAANDKLIVAGDYTGAGTGNSYTVTMDNTASTNFGPTVSGGPPQGISVNAKGTWTNGTSASTNYVFNWLGVFKIYAGGTVNIGTSGTRVPSTSTAKYQAMSAANVDTGIDVGTSGTLNVYGNALSFNKTLLTADAAAAATSLTTADSTSWKNGDSIALAATSRTATECEKVTLGADASGTSLPTVGALANAHKGTSPLQAEVVNLTRNVSIFGTSTSLQGYLIFATTATVAIDSVEFYNHGSATANKRGIDCQTTTGSCSITNSSIHDCTVASSIGFNVTGAASNNITFSNNVTFNIANSHFQNAASSATNWTADSNVFMKCTDSFTNLVTLGDVGGVFTNNTTVGATNGGVNIAETISSTGGQIGTFSGITSHSNAAYGILTASFLWGTLSNLTLWRNSNWGLNLAFTSTFQVIINTITAFGNATANIGLSSTMGNITINNPTLSGDSTFSTASGIHIQSGGNCVAGLYVNTADMGSVTGIKTAHTTADVNLNSSVGQFIQAVFNNSKFASSTELNGQTNMTADSYIASEKHDQTAGLHKTWKKYGTIAIETGTVHTGSQSISFTPNNASNKLTSGSFYAAVANGATVTPTVYINKSASYNGNQPRLILRRNDSIGVTSDTVIATYSAGTGSWNSISGTTAAATDDGVMEFVVDCDGTAGVCYVDSFTVA